jgi:rod shape-determining protein MreB
LGTLVVEHSIRVGGYELDEAIVRELQTAEKLVIGQEQAEALKIEIGSALPTPERPTRAEVAGRDLTTGLLRRAEVDAERIRAALARPLGQIVAAVKDVLERTPPELASDVSQRGLMLVGGGALLPGLDRLLHQETGLAVSIDPDPLTTVARGAGRALEELEQLTDTRRRRHQRRRH